MRSTSRALTVAASAVAPLLLVAACGGDSTTAGSGNDLTPITGSSYVTIEPATTTTTSTLPPTQGSGPEPGTISPVEQQYTIQSGDSLSKIASLYGVEIETICTYNSWTDCIDPPHLLLPGEIVRIPPESKVPDTGGSAATTVPADGGTATAPPAEGSTVDGECPTTYVIQSGDTTRIAVAEKFGITYEQMDAANVNTPGYANFVVGTPITIPCP